MTNFSKALPGKMKKQGEEGPLAERPKPSRGIFFNLLAYLIHTLAVKKSLQAVTKKDCNFLGWLFVSSHRFTGNVPLCVYLSMDCITTVHLHGSFPVLFCTAKWPHLARSFPSPSIRSSAEEPRRKSKSHSQTRHLSELLFYQERGGGRREQGESLFDLISLFCTRLGRHSKRPG